MTARPTSLPIAVLRSQGCRVHHVIGHWPTAPVSPNWHYGVVLPTREARRVVEALRGVDLHPSIRVSVDRYDPSRVLVFAKRDSSKPVPEWVTDADVATALTAITEEI